MKLKRLMIEDAFSIYSSSAQGQPTSTLQEVLIGLYYLLLLAVYIKTFDRLHGFITQIKRFHKYLTPIRILRRIR